MKVNLLLIVIVIVSRRTTVVLISSADLTDQLEDEVVVSEFNAIRVFNVQDLKSEIIEVQVVGID